MVDDRSERPVDIEQDRGVLRIGAERRERLGQEA
jgi:hypothetical protein